MRCNVRERAVALAVALAVVRQGCSTSGQVVRFETSARPNVRVTRSLFAKGSNSGAAPFQVRVKRGCVYRIRIQFDEGSLKAIGFNEAEVARLQESKSTVIEGGLVCPEAREGADRSVSAVLALRAGDLRATLDQGARIVSRAYDGAGNLRALFKASAAGVALDDPELAEHGTPVSTTLVVIGDVMIVAGIVALIIVAVLGIAILAAGEALAKAPPLRGAPNSLVRTG
ncbi:MAG: hypothetical protein ACYTDU_01680 [Planctomycetota bacterium]|jgi:hypothetical protein